MFNIFKVCFCLCLLCLFTSCCLMEHPEEQRSVIKFLHKSGPTPTQCWTLLHAVFGAETMSKAAVQKWHKQFHKGRESIKDMKRPGHPRSARTADNIQQVLNAVETKRTSTISEISQHLNLSESSVRTMLKKDLKLTKLSPKFIPKLLTDEQKAFRVRLCEENLDWLQHDNSFLTKIMTGDKSWVGVQELVLKKDSKEWH